MDKYQQCRTCPNAEFRFRIRDESYHFDDCFVIRCKIMGWDKFDFETCGEPGTRLKKPEKKIGFTQKIINIFTMDKKQEE